MNSRARASRPPLLAVATYTLLILICSGGLTWNLFWDTAAVDAMSSELVSREYLTEQALTTINIEHGSIQTFITGGRNHSPTLLWLAALILIALASPVYLIIASVRRASHQPTSTPP